jgi:cell division protein FtsB
VIARRLIIWSYAALFVVVGVLSGMFFFRTYQEYARLRQLEAESRDRLVRAQARLAADQVELDRLRSDPAYVRRVIRRQLRYAKPDELIFSFDRPSGEAPDGASR